MTHTRREIAAILVAAFVCWMNAAPAQALPGGLPECLDGLNVCQADLGACTTSLNASTASLAGCTTSLNACDGGLGTCTTSLNACDASLGTCTTNLTARDASLGTCTSNLTACDASLGTCTSNSTALTAELATCNTTLTACDTDLGSCRTDLSACRTDLGTCAADLSACRAAPAAAAEQFPASGQTTCWNSFGAVIACAGTGQDGDVRAGGTLAYTDNGDGTITDNNTNLVWEKKSADGSIHDVNAFYSWDEAFTVHVAQLNAGTFAGHNDWRVPNVKELQSIVDYERAGLTVSSAFDSNCTSGATVLTGSCTAAGHYWTSTTAAPAPGFAWTVHFSDLSGKLYKGFVLRVRAVRGGL